MCGCFLLYLVFVVMLYLFVPSVQTYIVVLVFFHWYPCVIWCFLSFFICPLICFFSLLSLFVFSLVPLCYLVFSFIFLYVPSSVFFLAVQSFPFDTPGLQGGRAAPKKKHMGQHLFLRLLVTRPVPAAISDQKNFQSLSRRPLCHAGV